MKDNEELMQQMLDTLPNDIDKREGSVIYTALAPIAAALVEQQFYLDGILAASMPDTAAGDDLTARCAWFGVDRYAATQAVREGIFTDGNGSAMEVPIGSRFGADGLTYTVTAQLAAGDYQLQCQTPGTAGNRYNGNLLSIDNVESLGAAIMTAAPLIPARDEETDEELRTRFYSTVRQTAYGGNVGDYEQKTLSIQGIGAVKVFGAATMGAGHVGIVIGDDQGNRATQVLVDAVQALMGTDGTGIAPIGHTVTVTTSTDLTVNVVAAVRLKTGANFEIVQPVVEQTISDYISLIGFQDETIFYAKLQAAILNCHDAILDIGSVTMNGASGNLSLTKEYENYQVPVLGTVTVTEVP